MKIYLATDHAGFSLKESIKKHLQDKNFSVEDFGAFTFKKDDDYPDFVAKAAEKISQNPNDRAIIFGGSGQAEAMLANKFKGVRAALFYATVTPVEAADIEGRKSSDAYEMIRLTREHNNANVLSLGARFLTTEQAIQAVDLWLSAPFDPNSRHARRVEKMKNIEDSI